MNSFVSFFIVSSLSIFAFASAQAKDVLVSSPDGAVTVAVGVKANKPYYTVRYEGKILVAPSHLGFQLDGGVLGNHARMTGKHYATKDETWTQPWGEELQVRNH